MVIMLVEIFLNIYDWDYHWQCEFIYLLKQHFKENLAKKHKPTYYHDN